MTHLNNFAIDVIMPPGKPSNQSACILREELKRRKPTGWQQNISCVASTVSQSYSLQTFVELLTMCQVQRHLDTDRIPVLGAFSLVGKMDIIQITLADAEVGCKAKVLH